MAVIAERLIVGLAAAAQRHPHVLDHRTSVGRPQLYDPVDIIRPAGRRLDRRGFLRISDEPPSRRVKCNVPLGHLAITSAIASALAAEGTIHGRRLLSNTAGSPRMHSAAWIQRRTS
jgi:hypothetical protein